MILNYIKQKFDQFNIILQEQNNMTDIEFEIEPEITLDITEDMYVGGLPQECIEDFVCMLCYGIVFKPIKCNTCETLICSNCVNSRVLNGDKKFMCFKKCGSKAFTRYVDLH